MTTGFNSVAVEVAEHADGCLVIAFEGVGFTVGDRDGRTMQERATAARPLVIHWGVYALDNLDAMQELINRVIDGERQALIAKAVRKQINEGTNT